VSLARRLTSFSAVKGLGLGGLVGLIEMVLAEVCRNRTDRSRIARPAGFEAQDGHQPACTSGMIVCDSEQSVNESNRGCLDL